MNSYNSLVMPMQTYNKPSTHDFLKQKAQHQNNLNNSVGGSATMTVPSFNTLNPSSPYNATSGSISNNSNYAKAKTNSQYDHYAFTNGGKKTIKQHKKNIKKHKKSIKKHKKSIKKYKKSIKKHKNNIKKYIKSIKKHKKIIKNK